MFQSTRPARGVTYSIYTVAAGLVFQSTRPARGVTPNFSASRTDLGTFQSTRPARGVTCGDRQMRRIRRFQSTRPARGVTPEIPDDPELFGVSIHTPRAGRDRYGKSLSQHLWVSIHTPARGVTGSSPRPVHRHQMFQSTRPARGVTYSRRITCDQKFQSTRPARGVTNSVLAPALSRGCFNPHARAGRDHNVTGRLLAR